jgi:hypothetical protein
MYIHHPRQLISNILHPHFFHPSYHHTFDDCAFLSIVTYNILTVALPSHCQFRYM